MERKTPEFDQRAIDEGINAERLLGDGTFQRALQRAVGHLKDDWVLADTVEERERLHARVGALDYVVVELMTATGDGKHAQHLKTRQEALEMGPGTSTDEGEQVDD